MFLSNIFISDDVIKLINLYCNYPNEVGGAIFGTLNKNNKIIKAISFKQGELSRIYFTEEDNRLFSPPNGLVLLGTWHSHPNYADNFPSEIDINQWKKWDKSFIHMIVTNDRLSLYNYLGVKISKFHKRKVR